MIPIKYNFRSLRVRRVGTLMTIFGVALTVSVFVSILAMVQGLEATFVETGEPLNLLLIRQGSQTETNSYFDREIKGIVESVEGVADVAGEIIVIINHPRVTGQTSNLIVRGVGENSLTLRPRVRLAEGRMFQRGLREAVVSRSIATRFKNAALGDSIRIGRTEWKIVGLLDASRTAYDSEIWADYNEVAQEFERPIYSSLLVRCASEDALVSVRNKLRDDRRVKLDTPTEREYFASQSGAGTAVKVLGYFIAVIMSIGSSFAVMNTMYAATTYRTREIATLRVMGFRRAAILFSFMLESLLLAILGGIVGCLMALPMNGISTGMTNFLTFSEVVFDFRITPSLMMRGVVFAAFMGALGGLLPARLASRMTIVRALRTEG